LFLRIIIEGIGLPREHQRAAGLPSGPSSPFGKHFSQKVLPLRFMLAPQSEDQLIARSMAIHFMGGNRVLQLDNIVDEPFMGAQGEERPPLEKVDLQPLLGLVELSYQEKSIAVRGCCCQAMGVVGGAAYGCGGKKGQPALFPLRID
jgi:hypothetical protein